MGPTQAPLGEGVDATFRTKPALKTIKNWSKIEKIGPGGTPWEAKNWNLQLRWPKMLPRVIFKRPWRPLGSALGGPRGSQVGAKSKLGVFFLSWKGKSIPSCFWMHFWSFWEPLGEAKTNISQRRSCKNQVFRKLRLNIVLRLVLEGFWRPRWG